MSSDVVTLSKEEIKNSGLSQNMNVPTVSKWSTHHKTSEHHGEKRQINVILLGDTGVGKTWLFQLMSVEEQERKRQVSGGLFSRSTIGVDQTVTYFTDDQGEEYKIVLNDTAGTERFNSITKSYVRASQICLLVCDCSNYASFLNLKKWHQFFCDHVSGGIESNGLSGRKVVFIIANKTDKRVSNSGEESQQSFDQQNTSNRRYVLNSDLDQYCKENRVAHYYTASAKLGEVPVEKFYSDLITLAKKDLISQTLEDDPKLIRLGNTQQIYKTQTSQTNHGVATNTNENYRAWKTSCNSC